MVSRMKIFAAVLFIAGFFCLVQASGCADSLIAATMSNDLKHVKALVSGGCDVNAYTPDGLTALHSSARYGKDTNILKYLLNKGASVYATTSIGATPLMYAVAFNPNSNVTKMLIDAKSDVTARLKERHNLEKFYDIEIYGSKTSKSQLSSKLSNAGFGLLDMAIMSQNLATVSLITTKVKKQYSEEEQYNLNKLAICVNDDTKILKALFKAGIDCRQSIYGGELAMDASRYGKGKEWFELLLQGNGAIPVKELHSNLLIFGIQSETPLPPQSVGFILKTTNRFDIDGILEMAIKMPVNDYRNELIEVITKVKQGLL